MQVEITYEYIPEHADTFPCFARAKVEGIRFVGCGVSFEKAKESILETLEKAKAGKQIPVPPTETVVV